MANADSSKDEVPTVNMVEWRSKYADILMEKVILLHYYRGGSRASNKRGANLNICAQSARETF